MESMDKDADRLDPVAFGFALGTAMAAGVAFVGVVSRFGWAERWRTLFADAYPGFEADESGTLAGIAWGGVDGFLAGASIGWLYNVFRRE